MSTRSKAAAVDEIAQTNLQLLGQMRNSGYDDTDLARTSMAYRLAAGLFANQFRACGKPFVAHLVGTAGVLAWLQAPITVVLAGLLHAVYQEGDFPRALPGMTSGKRRYLLGAAGQEVEALVAAYTEGSRSLDGIRASYAGYEKLSELDRTVLLMQLANELDDYRDLAPLHARNCAERLEKIELCGEQQAELAERLGYPALAQALRQTFTRCLEASATPALSSEHANAYAIVPASCRPAIAHLALRAHRKLGRSLRHLRSR